MITSIYSWIVNHKRLAIAVCVLLILVLIINLLTSNELEKEEKWLKEEEEKIRQAEEAKQKPQIDFKMMGNKHYNLWEHKKGKVSDHYFKAINYFETLLANSQQQPQQPQHEVTGDVFYKLARLYHIGVNDSYSKMGQKEEGVDPNVQKALYYYMLSAQMGNAEGLLNVADLYRWGLNELAPNIEYAKQLYLVLRQAGDDYYKGIAKDRILQIKEDEGSVIGSGVDAGNFNTQFHEAFENYGQGTLDEDFDVNLDGKNVQVNDLMNNLKIPQILNAPSDQSLASETKSNNNPDNVSDHIVDNTIKQIWTKLKSSTPETMNPQTVFLDIKRYILAQRGNEDKKQDALKALAEISTGLESRAYEESKEIDAIVLIWNRIHSNVNTANKNILKANLFNELAECVEHSEVVCRKGRIARLFDALNMVDPDVQIKPKWAVNEEMRNYAIKLKNDMSKTTQPHIRDALNSAWPSPEQVELVGKFNEKFKRDLIELFHKKYVDTGCMSADLLKTEMKKWIEYL